jgi:hypothetical protein
MTRLEFALQLAADGFWLFPLREGRKTPAFKGWQAMATRDPEILRRWFEPGTFNIGLFTEKFGDDEALLVVDVDKKHGNDGAATIFSLEMQGYEFPATRTVATPSGGCHMFYRIPRPVRPGSHVFGTALDVRSGGSYVVAVGSATGGAFYVLVEDRPVAPAPDWMLAQCSERVREPAERSDAPVAGVDRGRAHARAADYLRNHAPLAIEGAGGDDTTYKVGCRVREFGVDQATALDLMLTEWNDRCAPPWDADDLAVKVANAYGYAENRQGVADPKADFGVWVDPRQGKLHFELFKDVQPDLSRRPLIKGLLDHGTMSVLYGDSNTGKTFVAMSMGFHVATGREWHGRGVEQGGVVYVAAEGGGNARKRVAALRKHYGVSDVAFALVPCAVDLGGAGADVEPLLKLIAAAQIALGGTVALLVIDTLSRAMNGGEENQSKDMTAFVANVDRLRTGAHAHTMVVHHTGKDQAKGARGHSSLRAATDTELEVADHCVTATKQRDMDAGPKIGFRLQVVDVGADPDGEQITSCVVEPAAVDAGADFAAKLPKCAAIAWTALQNLTMNEPKILRDDWLAEFQQSYGTDKPETAVRAFNRGRLHLEAMKITASDSAYAWAVET